MLSITFLELVTNSFKRLSSPEIMFNLINKITLFNQVVAGNKSSNQIHGR